MRLLPARTVTPQNIAVPSKHVDEEQYRLRTNVEIKLISIFKNLKNVLEKVVGRNRAFELKIKDHHLFAFIEEKGMKLPALKNIISKSLIRQIFAIAGNWLLPSDPAFQVRLKRKSRRLKSTWKGF